jgi:hypothetical protein
MALKGVAESIDANWELVALLDRLESWEGRTLSSDKRGTSPLRCMETSPTSALCEIGIETVF